MITGDVSPSRFTTGSAAARSISARLGALECFALRNAAACSEAAPAVAPARNFLRFTCIPDSLPPYDRSGETLHTKIKGQPKCEQAKTPAPPKLKLASSLQRKVAQAFSPARISLTYVDCRGLLGFRR